MLVDEDRVLPRHNTTGSAAVLRTPPVTARRGVVVVLVLVALVLAFVYLGPKVALTVAARAVIASIVYRLIRRAVR